MKYYITVSKNDLFIILDLLQGKREFLDDIGQQPETEIPAWQEVENILEDYNIKEEYYNWVKINSELYHGRK